MLGRLSCGSSDIRYLLFLTFLPESHRACGAANAQSAGQTFEVKVKSGRAFKHDVHSKLTEGIATGPSSIGAKRSIACARSVGTISQGGAGDESRCGMRSQRAHLAHRDDADLAHRELCFAFLGF